MTINTNPGPAFDGCGRLIAPGHPFVSQEAGPAAIDRSADTEPADLQAGGNPNPGEAGNATAEAIAAKKAADAIADIASLEDRDALAVLATDARATVAKAAGDRLAALATPPAEA